MPGFLTRFFTVPGPPSVYSWNATAATVTWLMDDPIRWQNLNITWMSAWLADFLCALRAKDQGLCLPQACRSRSLLRGGTQGTSLQSYDREKEKVCVVGDSKVQRKMRNLQRALVWAGYSGDSSLLGYQSMALYRFPIGENGPYRNPSLRDVSHSRLLILTLNLVLAPSFSGSSIFFFNLRK